MKMVDNYGVVMVDITALKRRGEDLVVKGKIMGSMPGTFYLKPAEVWSVLGLLSWQVLSYLPVMLFKGWQRSGKSKKHPEGKERFAR